MISLGHYRQLGLVVRDIDVAIDYWARVMGIGPFLLLRRRIFDDYEFRGRPATAPVVSIAIAFNGPLQIELIQQHNDAPSAYAEFLEAGVEGMQHLCAWFDSHAGYDLAYSQLLSAGMTVVQQGRSRGVNVRFAYFENPSAPQQPLIEISEALLPVPRKLFDELERDCSTWTGTPRFREITIPG